MTGAIRTAVRATASTALRTVSGWKEHSAWTQTTDLSALPGWGVATPQARQDRIDHDGTQEHSITLAVVLKRAGAPETLESALDADGDTFAGLVEAAVQTDSRDCEPVSTALRIDREGATPVGVLTLQFDVTTWA